MKKRENKTCKYCKGKECWLNAPDSIFTCKNFSKKNKKIPCINQN